MPSKVWFVTKTLVVQDSKLDQNSPSASDKQPKKQKEFLDLKQSVQTLDDAKAINQLDNFVKSNINKANDGSNPFSINIYTFGYNTNKNLTTINSAIKENLKPTLINIR